jgi:hypothetical protein
VNTLRKLDDVELLVRSVNRDKILEKLVYGEGACGFAVFGKAQYKGTFPMHLASRSSLVVFRHHAPLLPVVYSNPVTSLSSLISARALR